MSNYLLLAIILAVMGIAMVIAGIHNLRSGDNQDTGSAKKPQQSTMSSWMFGGSSGMDAKRAGRARMTLGVILIIVALILAAEFYF